MTGAERQVLRRLIDQRRRQLCADDPDGLPPQGNHGKPSTYKRGCRCDVCRAASTAARRASRARLLAKDERRARLVAACATGSPVRPVDQVRSVLRMLDQQAKKSTSAPARDLGGSSTGGREGGQRI